MQKTVIGFSDGKDLHQFGIATYNVPTIDVFHKGRVDRIMSGAATASVQFQQALVCNLEKVGVCPFVHGLEDRDRRYMVALQGPPWYTGAHNFCDALKGLIECGFEGTSSPVWRKCGFHSNLQ